MVFDEPAVKASLVQDGDIQGRRRQRNMDGGGLLARPEVMWRGDTASADDEDEQGFHDLRPFLRTDFLRLGLEAGLFLNL